MVRTLHRYWKMTQDPRTPAIVRWLIYGGIAFTVTPESVKEKLLPDWIPGLGLLDDAAVVPSVVAASMLLIPKEVKEAHEEHAERALEEKRYEGVESRSPREQRVAAKVPGAEGA